MTPKRIGGIVCTTILTTVLVLPSNVQAQDAGADDAAPEPQAEIRDDIVVTAHRMESPADSVGSSVTVITAEEIAARGKTSVAELLRTVAGLEVVRGGGGGQVTSVFLRGGSSSHTLVLVDGVRMNNAATGAFDFADLTSDQIERIEVLRGPQSTLYGSEAMTGVVSITTRRGLGVGASVEGLAEAGSHGHQRLRLGVDGTAGRFDYHLTASDLRTDGVSAAAAPATEDDPYENTSLAGRAGFDFAGDGRLDLVLRSFTGDVSIDGFDFLAGPVDDLNRLQERDALLGGLTFKKSLGRLQQTVFVGFHDDEIRGSDPEDAFGNFTFRSRDQELTLQSDVTVTQDDVLSFGYTFEERRVDGTSFDESIEIESIYLQNVFSKDRFSFTVGGRYDDHSHFGGEATFRLAASWKATASTRLHTSYGTAFKAPTLNDLFFPFFSNPDLEPETNRGLDLGLEQRFGDNVTLDVTYFESDFEDLIAFDFVTFLPQNLAAAESRGVEATLTYRAGPHFEMRTAYTWNETEDLATGQRLARRPEHRGVVDFFLKPTEKLRATATLIVVRERIDSDTTPMDDYERVDLNVRYRLSPSWEPYLRVENLFDEDYEELNGFTTPGAVAFVGLGWRF